MGHITTVGGNIGSGKSTVLKKLESKLATSHVFVSEPIDKWGDWLRLFYEDKKKYAFSFQMKILYEYVFVKNIPSQTRVISERSPLDSTGVFAQHLVQQGYLNSHEYDLLKDCNKVMGWEPDVYIYVRTDPRVCYDRMVSRNRNAESGVPIEYLAELHSVYEGFYQTIKNSGIKCYVVDGNGCMETTHASVLRILELHG